MLVLARTLQTPPSSDKAAILTNYFAGSSVLLLQVFARILAKPRNFGLSYFFPCIVQNCVLKNTGCCVGLGDPECLLQNLVLTKLGTVPNIRKPGKSCRKNEIFTKFSKKSSKSTYFWGGLTFFCVGLGTRFLI